VIGGDGTRATVRVVQTDNASNIEAKLEGWLVDTREIGKSVKGKLGDAAIVECPRRWVVLKAPGETASCTVRLGDERGNLVIYGNEAAETLGWKIAPAG
jgi:hypothetical protein